MTILELAEKIHKINGVKFNPKFLPPRDYDTQRRQPDISKIKACFSQYNFVNLNQGLRRML